ncbi:RNA polymerase sigma factor [Myxococcus sp. CA040A]|uniref:RNA polymerase sigma factor n=1 Tax=Myxococcus sp. CA040A TaxID=2741738 RepID=UPI00157ADD3B|nr:sigma-70 family RNA polymerase sigma factor [Myxococcus sp. CA040A]NTX01826.1 sigma-70 family RNA polymerase sigma factor [Myxococcus sp. CA040A]
MRYPSKAEEEALHAKILQKDVTAPAEVHRAFMDVIIHVLDREVPCRHREVAHDSAIDAVLHYLKAPERFDPHRGRLSTYLTQIAKKRALDRRRTLEKRELREQKYAGEFELVARSPKEALEATVEARLLMDRLESSGLVPEEQAFLRLVLQGEGSTERLAVALGLGPLPEDERRRQVKRHRDRLMKRLQRLGREDVDVDP